MKVAIIDSNPVIREGTVYILTSNFQNSEVRQYPNVQEFIQMHDKLTPDIIILGMNKVIHEKNLNTILDVLGHCPYTPLVVFDERRPLDRVLDYFRTGVRGYLRYNTGAEGLIECFKKVLGGMLYVPANILADMINGWGRLVKKPPTSKLTEREHSIALLLANGKKAAEIGTMFGVKAATIFATKRMIFRKLGISSFDKLKQACAELEGDQSEECKH